MKVLFVVHAEKMFEDWMGSRFKVALCKEVYGGGYDEVIILNSELGASYNESGLIECIDSDEFTQWAWGWGYEPEMFDDDEEQWVIEGSPAHEWTWVPPEARDNAEGLRNADVWLAGGCDSECLENWRCVLDHMGIRYNETQAIY